MNETTLIQYILDSFPHIETSENFSYRFFFYGADRMRPFASLANADYVIMTGFRILTGRECIG